MSFSRKYINEGLRDRAVTRDLDWGIEVPEPGYEEKKIYIWAENVLGYLSASQQVAESRGDDFNELWFGKAQGIITSTVRTTYRFTRSFFPGCLCKRQGLASAR